VPVGVKDVIRTRDLPTTFNSPVYEGFQAKEDAHVVATLRASGAVILGKTQTLEFACGGRFPPTRNPWDLARTPGGSSSGSGAAVADGMVPLALGTQTGGSTIRPAAFCGVHAMKPTWGRIPFDGIKSFAAHLDTIGFYGRSVADLAMLWDAYDLIEPPGPAGRVGDGGQARLQSAPGSTGTPVTDRLAPSPLRLGLCRTPLWNQAEPEARAALESLLEGLAGAGVEVQYLDWDPAFDAINTWQDEIMQDGGRSAFRPEWLQAPDRLHEEFQRKLGNQLQLTPARMRAALDAVARCRIDFEQRLQGLDAAVSLSAPGVAPLGLHTQGMATFNRLWTALQVPCISLPALWSAEGLPMGLQLVQARYEDERLLQVAARLEALLPPTRRPWN
jgi:Asp-tRNA(Asn)/Glu-tRNA(Gln) amidotransferase A subunit family amidase